jgi:hypothetical protein
MPEITQITTHVTDARARIIHQFRGLTDYQTILDAIVDQIQDFEDGAFDLFDLLDIDVMTGVNLDTIGEIVGEARQGKTDANYRIAIRQAITTRYGSGTPDELITLFQYLTGSTLANIDYYERYPAGYGIYGDVASYPTGTFESMEQASPAGVLVALYSRLLQEGSSDLITTEATEAIYVATVSSGG